LIFSGSKEVKATKGNGNFIGINLHYETRLFLYNLAGLVNFRGYFSKILQWHSIDIIMPIVES